MNTKNRGNCAAALILLGMCLLFAGCSSDTTPDTGSKEVSYPGGYAGTPVPEWREFEAMLNEALMRLKYGDKSGLYELEFEYLRDEKTFDAYLAMGEIQWASMDSINHLEVKNITIDEDSTAAVDIVYVFDSQDGGYSEYSDTFTIYRRNGRWIKPTVSIIANQLRYEKIIRDAEESAKQEASERDGK